MWNRLLSSECVITIKTKLAEVTVPSPYMMKLVAMIKIKIHSD
jgi:hypothetical protein